MKKLFHKLIIVIVGLVSIISLQVYSSPSAHAYHDDYESFEADYYLERAPDGASILKVREEISVTFPDTDQNHGILRIIPRTNQGRKNLTVPSLKALQLRTARNNLAEKPHDIEVERNDITVYLGDPDEYVHGAQLYQLDYQFQNVITEFEDQSSAWQELYWNANGTDWTNGFKQVIARVHFGDSEIAESFTDQSWCYVGRYGASDQAACTTTPLEDGLEFRTTNLDSYENLTFVLQFQPNTFVIPGPTYDYRLPIILAVELIAAIVSAIFLIKLWRQTLPKRNYFHSLFIKPEYAPPAGFTVAEMAENYLSKSQLGSSKVATILELAVTHKIDLIEVPAKSKRKSAKPTWQIKLLSLDFTPAQETTLRLLAGKDQKLTNGQVIDVKQHAATSSLIKLEQKFSQQVDTELENKHLLIKDCKNCNRLLSFGVIWLLLNCIALPLLIISGLEGYAILVGGAPFMTAIVMLVAITVFIDIAVPAICKRYLSHTETGLELSRQLDGLKLYIKLAEAERLKFLQSVQGAELNHQGIVNLYEKLLPYAILFKQERSWLKELEKYYQFNDTKNPSWYHNSSGTFSGDFALTMLAFSRQAQSSTSPITSSSSGGSSHSGSFGGGFSGGGGGGGGGGSW